MVFGFSGHCFVELCCLEVRKAVSERNNERKGCKDVTWNTLTELECITERCRFIPFFSWSLYVVHG